MQALTPLVLWALERGPGVQALVTSAARARAHMGRECGQAHETKQRRPARHAGGGGKAYRPGPGPGCAGCAGCRYNPGNYYHWICEGLVRLLYLKQVRACVLTVS